MREKGFDYGWLKYYLNKLANPQDGQKFGSIRQKYIIEKTVLLNMQDKYVARRLRITRQRVQELRRIALANLGRLMVKEAPPSLGLGKTEG